MGKLCWPNTGRGEAHIPGALHCRSSTCSTEFNADEMASTCHYVRLSVEIFHIS